PGGLSVRASLAGLESALREHSGLGRVVAERLPERVRRLQVKPGAFGPVRPRRQRYLRAELRQRCDDDGVRVLLVPGGDLPNLRGRDLVAVLEDDRAVLEV